MIIELGHFLLALALSLSIFQFLVPVLGVKFNSDSMMKSTSIIAFMSFILVLFSFLSLVYAYITSDFSVSLVTKNSHSLKPLLYKISGVWGNHEGSLLLWVLILTFYSAAVAILGRRLPLKLLSLVLSCQGLIAAAFISFILFTSNPFVRVFFPNAEGEGFNPILQDFGLAIHPPFLYLGYVGLSVTFSFSIAALLVGKVDTIWVKWVRPWTLLAIIAFSFCLLVTFIVRSGVLVSVHAFASDPSRGLYILLLLVFFTGGGLALFAKRAPYLKSGSLFKPLSREGALVINNIIFTSAAATVLLGTLYPIFIDAINNSKVSVGPPYFEAVFIPLMVPAILLCAFSPMLSWKRAIIDNIIERIIAVFICSLFLASLIIIIHGGSASAFLGLFLAFWLICGTLYEFFIKVGIKSSFKTFIQRALNLPRSAYGMSVAHIGVAIFIIGVTVSSAWRIDIEKPIILGEKIIVKDIELTFKDIKKVEGPNWNADRGEFEIITSNGAKHFLYPERRFYPASQVNTSEPAIMSGIFSDLYIVLGESLKEEDSYAFRIYYSPFISWIWFGIFFMAMGGILSLSDRKHRLGYGLKQV